LLHPGFPVCQKYFFLFFLKVCVVPSPPCNIFLAC
jgi:hypothetical protein